MKSKVIYATIAGSIVMLLLGGLIHDGILKNLISRPEGSREDYLIGFIFISGLFYSYMITQFYDKWANIRTWIAGLKMGIFIAFLITVTRNLLVYATLSTHDIPTLVYFTLAQLIMVGLTGAIIGLVLGYDVKKKNS